MDRGQEDNHSISIVASVQIEVTTSPRLYIIEQTTDANRNQTAQMLQNSYVRINNETSIVYFMIKKMKRNFLLTRSCFYMDRKLQLCCVNSSKGMHRMLKSTEPFPRPVPLGVRLHACIWFFVRASK